MKKITFLALCLVSQMISAQTKLSISSAIRSNADMPFIERAGALALNVRYEGFDELRNRIASTLGLKLKFFDGWSKSGEAHVTTITPPEYQNFLAPYLSWETINEIAQQEGIQSSDLEILGLGSGKKTFGSEVGETFFIIVHSRNLLRIRREIYKRYLLNGGPVAGVKAFDPDHFYPHITVGFTHSDIHEIDGLIKDMNSSKDVRFSLVLR